MDCTHQNNSDIDSDSDEERYTKLEKLLSMQEKIRKLIAFEEEMIEKKRKSKLDKLKTEKELNTSDGSGMMIPTVPSEMKYKEILQLAQNINELPPNKLLEVVLIIRSREPSLRNADPNNFFVNFQKLKSSTHRRLQKYLMDCEKSEEMSDFTC